MNLPSLANQKKMIHLFVFVALTLVVAQSQLLLPTPFGLQHKECIIEASNGATVDQNETHLIVTSLEGVVTVHVPAPICTGATTTTTAAAVDPSCNSPPCTCNSLPCNNWIDNAGSMNQQQIIGGMSATYLTPQTPATTNGQTLFYFIGAENTNGNPRQGQPPPSGRAILQPVLTYDPSGWCVNSTTGWCFSSWYCCPKNVTTHSPYIQDIHPGDAFLGSFNLSTDGTVFTTVSQNIKTGAKTVLKAPRQGRDFNWADITQEVYNMKSCDNFASSAMVFNQVHLWDTTYQKMLPDWLLTTEKPCGGRIVQNNEHSFSIMHSPSSSPPPPTPTPPTPLGQPPGKWIPYLPLTDEFNQNQLDATKWSTDYSVVGWHGRQPGLFASSNVQVSNGTLKLYARAATRNASWPAGYDNYTTSAVHSLNRTSQGYFEIKAKSGNSSISSSFWFHQNGQSDWTEIDVYESMGSDDPEPHRQGMNSSLMCSHTHIFKLNGVATKDLPQKCGCVLSGTVCSTQSCALLPNGAKFDTGFHVYGLMWNDTHVEFYANGVKMSTMNAVCFNEKIGLDFDRETMFDWMGAPKRGFVEDRPYEIEYVRAWKESA